MCLCWNSDGSMCDPADIPRRIKLSMEGRWKVGYGEVPKGEGTMRPMMKRKKVEYNAKECGRRWQEHIARQR